MTENKINAALGMFYLCGCVLTDAKPHDTSLAQVKLQELYEASVFHSLTAMVCEGLEKAGVYEDAFRQAKEKSVRKNLLLDTERAKLFAFMEQKGIWYMPLKGIVLKDIYPKIGLRQMSDNDILFDESHRKDIRDWFVSQGYEIKHYGKGNHDVYWKSPVYNYEMHISLYGTLQNATWRDYYQSVKKRLVKDEENGFGYHFTDEDFYVYFISHAHKHYDESGTGIRFLLDLYAYIKNKPQLDFEYIEKQLQALGVSEFEKNCRALVFEAFEDINAFEFEKLGENKQKLLKSFCLGGTYGTAGNRVQKAVKKQGKFKYFIWRLFPGTDVLSNYHPIFKHKWLVPIGWVYRAIKIVFCGLGNAIKELGLIFKSEK